MNELLQTECECSKKYYQIGVWGHDFFSVDDKGALRIHPDKKGEGLDLHQFVCHLLDKGLSTPILLRFDGILKSRLDELVKSFQSAIVHNSYKGNYLPVFPIKVNHHNEVVKTLLRVGHSYHLGLEAGSKPELLAILGQSTL
jgi:arginine decarboxylase